MAIPITKMARNWQRLCNARQRRTIIGSRGARNREPSQCVLVQPV